MNNGWQVKTLGEVCDFRPPKAEARERLSPDAPVTFAPMENLGIDTKYLRIGDEKPLSAVSGSYTYFADGDVLLAKITPCFENGKVGIARDLRNGIGFGSSEFFVIRPTTALDSEFLYYYLSRPQFRAEGAARMGGAVGQQRVPRDFIERSRIPVPPILEQKRIVSVLDEAFEGIAVAKANAEKNLQNARALFESRLASVFVNGTAGWKKTALSDLGTITSSKRIFKEEYVTDGVPFYRTKEIKELAHERPISTELFITEQRYLEIARNYGVPKSGDVLLTAIGTIGEIYVVKENDRFYFKDGNVLWLKDFTHLTPNFLKYVLLSFVEGLNEMANGAAYSALTIERLNKHRVFVPSVDQQALIVRELDSLLDSTRTLESIYEQKLTALDELKESLLHQAFTGKL